MAEGKDILVILLSYAIGCVSTGYYLTKLCARTDIRKSGSGSTGARNVGRILGRTGFIATFAGDTTKGLIAIWIASMLTQHHWAIMASLPAVVMGHIWPAQLGLRGGKGIAVTLGGVFFVDYRIAITCCIVFAVCLLCSRRYLLSGLTAVMMLPVAAAVRGYSAGDFIDILIPAILIMFAHRGNIAELILRKHADGSQ